jgi:hypothetical protein
VLVADAAQNQCFVAQKVTLEEMEYVAPPPNPTASKESAAGKKGSVIKATASSNHSDGTKAKEEQVRLLAFLRCEFGLSPCASIASSALYALQFAWPASPQGF